MTGTSAQHKGVETWSTCAQGCPFPCRYMVDAADQEKIEASKNELHNLLDKPQLQGIPVSCCLSLCPQTLLLLGLGTARACRADSGRDCTVLEVSLPCCTPKGGGWDSDTL